MWSVNPIDPYVAMTAAAERYALHAAWVSVPLIVASIAVFFFLRNDLMSSSLAAATLFVHPVWTVTDAWYDNGATLRLASTIWIVVGCVAISSALFAVYRHGIKTRGRWNPRFAIRSLLILTVIVVIILVLTRPPLTEQIPVSRSLPALGLVFSLVIAACSRDGRHQRRRPMQIDIPFEFNGDCNTPETSSRKP